MQLTPTRNADHSTEGAFRQELYAFHHNLSQSHSNDLQELATFEGVHFSLTLAPIVMSGTNYFTLLHVYRYLREKSDEFNMISIINVEESEAFRKDCEDEACHIVTNMQYGSGLWYSGATEGGKPCGRGVLVKSCKKTAVVLRGTFSPYKGHFIPHASLPILVVERGLFSRFAFYQGNATTMSYCKYDGPFDSNLELCGLGTITYPELDDGYRQYVGSLCPRVSSVNYPDVGWCGEGTLTLTDGTTYRRISGGQTR